MTPIEVGRAHAAVRDGARGNAGDTRRRELGISISIRTILLAAVVVAAGAALASISVAVLSPVATAMERRLGWSRRACSMLLVLGIVVVIAPLRS